MNFSAELAGRARVSQRAVREDIRRGALGQTRPTGPGAGEIVATLRIISSVSGFQENPGLPASNGGPPGAPAFGVRTIDRRSCASLPTGGDPAAVTPQSGAQAHALQTLARPSNLSASQTDPFPSGSPKTSHETRVVITGCGAVCGAGRMVEAIWDAIVNGRSAIREISSWDATRWPVRQAAEVTGVDNRTLVEDRKLHKLISRTDLFGLYAAGAAIQQSGIPAHRESLAAEAVPPFNDRCGVFAGSGGGNYRSNYDFFPLLTAAGGDLQKFGHELGENVNPMWLLKILPNNVVCHVGIRHNFKGTNACITNQCVGGALAVAEAAAALRAGEADRAIAVGHDTPFEPETVLHYHRLGLVSPDTLRPFDRARRGTVLGEGAAAVMLETAADAQARQAAILGEFLGSGCTTEATGIVNIRPDGEGLSRAIELALGDAGVSADAVGMIVAHGNGTRASDASEALALRRVFGQNLPPVTGFKWAFGHLIAASGTLDLVMALAALRQGVVPGIATLNALDADLDPFPASPQAQQPRSDIALVLCRGFGGMNVASLVRAAASPSGR